VQTPWVAVQQSLLHRHQTYRPFTQIFAQDNAAADPEPSMYQNSMTAVQFHQTE
jgi:hypothetical protein